MGNHFKFIVVRGFVEIMQLKDQTAVVTGGGKGIGKSICLALAKEGANIIPAARTESDIEKTKREVEEIGTQSMAVKTDVTKEEDVKNLVSKSIDTFGGIDIFVNNAGVGLRKPFIETSLDEFEKVIEVNLKGVFLGMKHALPHMQYNNSGKIINISSGAGKSGIPELSVYSASKFGVIGLTESTAREVGSNVQIYAVCPGGVDTDMYRSMFSGRPHLKPDDVAKKVVELCMPSTNIPSGSSVEIYR
ncbi:short-chain dehydrogenase/reductase SDR [Methanohalobium evestigatum Z-7303]|uniref:Short-chain dehydrogenase/reductase SDR n=2 Tax=Methanohalobium evestigatum TaxID=2322 RepID=D7E735_METEZ|nr:short-chain dehydrogenase/reductase SDR [Methanohalobium evestigatum Z-7303]